ncbi:MAG: DNA mismatch repair endonuclease MutL [Endomicrobiaceae bacterium]|nr:DNA mismatch repair endonuclease MutL [Endomicrobiaceae bacterium]
MIKILDDKTIDKISAGEVVDRPLNVVKELVENSLDAGATSISIEIEKSGKKLIRVSDNGHGMNKEDLVLSVQRHATSKIDTFDDLSTTITLGFRGEALPSIAAISIFDIKTQETGSDSGWHLSIEGSKQANLQPWAGSGGTIVEVKNLFFNTPVREKFLKSDTTEKAKIINCIDEIALVRNDIDFKIISDGKTLAQYQKTDSKIKRIEDVLGRDLSKKLKYINFNHPKIDIEAFVSTRENSLAQRNAQYLFVNSRCVNYPKWLIHSIYQAYKQATPIGRHPAVIMFLKSNPSDIDINVHPTKREIKFAKENEMYELFYTFIKGTVESDEPSSIVNVKSGDEKEQINNNRYNYKPNYIPNRDVSVSDYKNLYSSNIGQAHIQEELLQSDEYKFIGQIFSMYIIVERYNMCYIIDQHAGQERVKYEMFSDEVQNNTLDIQQLLIPDVFELQGSKSIVLKNSLTIFNKLGFTLEEFGGNTFRLTSYPALLGGDVSFIEIINGVIEFLEEEKSAQVQEIQEVIIQIACKTSIKAGDILLDKQAVQLAKELFACKMPYTCPHGRPTMYKITREELEKFFKRT